MTISTSNLEEVLVYRRGVGHRRWQVAPGFNTHRQCVPRACGKYFALCVYLLLLNLPALTVFPPHLQGGFTDPQLVVLNHAAKLDQNTEPPGVDR